MKLLFLLIWILIYFICHLQAESGFYMFNTESARHTLDFTAPLLIMAAIGITMVDSALITRMEKFVFRIVVSLTIFLIPFSHINEIRDRGGLQSLLNETIATASWYPRDTMFLTNAVLIQDALDMDLRANVRLLNKTNSASQLCKDGRKCVFVLLRKSETEGFEKILDVCPDSMRYHDLEVAICPFYRADDIPPGFFTGSMVKTGGGDYDKNLPYREYGDEEKK